MVTYKDFINEKGGILNVAGTNYLATELNGLTIKLVSPVYFIANYFLKNLGYTDITIPAGTYIKINNAFINSDNVLQIEFDTPQIAPLSGYYAYINANNIAALNINWSSLKPYEIAKNQAINKANEANTVKNMNFFSYIPKPFIYISIGLATLLLLKK